MTPQQAKTLAFLKTYSAERNGVMPSFDEIAAHIGVRSKSGVSRIVDALVERGMVRRTSLAARSIKIVDVDAAAAERERCARIADDHAARCQRGSAVSSMAEDAWGAQAAREIAKAIRRTS